MSFAVLSGTSLKMAGNCLNTVVLLSRFCSARTYVNDLAIKFSCCFVCSVAAVHCFRNGREELWKFIICIFYFASFLSVLVISRDLTKR
jgi:hypothetical protein